MFRTESNALRVVLRFDPVLLGIKLRERMQLPPLQFSVATFPKSAIPAIRSDLRVGSRKSDAAILEQVSVPPGAISSRKRSPRRRRKPCW